MKIKKQSFTFLFLVFLAHNASSAEKIWLTARDGAVSCPQKTLDKIPLVKVAKKYKEDHIIFKDFTTKTVLDYITEKTKATNSLNKANYPFDDYINLYKIADYSLDKEMCKKMENQLFKKIIENSRAILSKKEPLKIPINLNNPNWKEEVNNKLSYRQFDSFSNKNSQIISIDGQPYTIHDKNLYKIDTDKNKLIKKADLSSKSSPLYPGLIFSTKIKPGYTALDLPVVDKYISLYKIIKDEKKPRKSFRTKKIGRIVDFEKKCFQIYGTTSHNDIVVLRRHRYCFRPEILIYRNNPKFKTFRLEKKDLLPKGKNKTIILNENTIIISRPTEGFSQLDKDKENQINVYSYIKEKKEWKWNKEREWDKERRKWKYDFMSNYNTKWKSHRYKLKDETIIDLFRLNNNFFAIYSETNQGKKVINILEYSDTSKPTIKQELKCNFPANRAFLINNNEITTGEETWILNPQKQWVKDTAQYDIFTNYAIQRDSQKNPSKITLLVKNKYDDNLWKKYVLHGNYKRINQILRNKGNEEVFAFNDGSISVKTKDTTKIWLKNPTISKNDDTIILSLLLDQIRQKKETVVLRKKSWAQLVWNKLPKFWKKQYEKTTIIEH